MVRDVLGDLVVTEGLLERFLEWCVGEWGSDERTCRDRAAYLRRPLDLGNSHSVKAYRLLFRMLGREPPFELRVPSSGVDLRVPDDGELLASLERVCGKGGVLCIVYKLLVESGARLAEVVDMVSNYDAARDAEHGGFYTYAIARDSRTKRSFYIFHTTPIDGPRVISRHYVTKVSRELGIVRPKHVRKWVATKMIMLGIDSTVVDFMQGRTPKNVLTRHYLNLYTLALQQYPKYSQWLRQRLEAEVGKGGV